MVCSDGHDVDRVDTCAHGWRAPDLVRDLGLLSVVELDGLPLLERFLDRGRP